MDETRRQLADRAQAERLEVAERLRCLGGEPCGGRAVTGWQVGADDRGPARVYAGTQSFVGELERRLDARPGRGAPPEDLRDRLDCLDVRCDREFEPRADARACVSAVRRFVGARLLHPSPSFSRNPPAFGATLSPVSAAYSVRSSR